MNRQRVSETEHAGRRLPEPGLMGPEPARPRPRKSARAAINASRRAPTRTTGSRGSCVRAALRQPSSPPPAAPAGIRCAWSAVGRRDPGAGRWKHHRIPVRRLRTVRAELPLRQPEPPPVRRWSRIRPAGEDGGPTRKKATGCDPGMEHEEPSCVYACPHDAAHRVEPLAFSGDARRQGTEADRIYRSTVNERPTVSAQGRRPVINDRPHIGLSSAHWFWRWRWLSFPLRPRLYRPAAERLG
jgi:hypothetical protein